MQALTELPITLHLHHHPREVGGEGEEGVGRRRERRKMRE